MKELNGERLVGRIIRAKRGKKAANCDDHSFEARRLACQENQSDDDDLRNLDFP